MEVTTPKEMTSVVSKLELAINDFEELLLSEEKGQEYYHLVIVGEYNRATCDEIQNIYTKAGWAKVVCKTSSENGERPGLTGLQLYINK